MTDREQRDTNLFDTFAKDYDKTHMSETSLLALRYELLNALKLYSPSTSPSLGDVVDVGCGGGALYQIIIDYSKSYLGVDLSQELISKAKKRLLRSSDNFVVGNAKQTGIDSHSKDTAIFSGALHHIDQSSSALQETYRILRPGGKLLLLETNGEGKLVSILRFIRSKISKSYSKEQVFFSKEFLISQVRDAGFINIKGTYQLYLTGFFESTYFNFVPKGLYKKLYQYSEDIDKLIYNTDVDFIRKQSFGLTVVAQKPQSNPSFSLTQ